MRIWSLALIGLLLLGGCITVDQACPEPATGAQSNQSTMTTTPSTQPHAMGAKELTDQALLSDLGKSISATDVTVNGVRLGDDFQQMLDMLGTPQVIDEFDGDDVINAKYENDEGFTSVIYHFEQGKISRIVVRGGLNDKLPSANQVNMTLDDITRTFGKPDKEEDVLLKDSGYRVYYYYDKGLEIYHVRKHMVGYALVPPQKAAEMAAE